MNFKKINTNEEIIDITEYTIPEEEFPESITCTGGYNLAVVLKSGKVYNVDYTKENPTIGIRDYSGYEK